MVQTQQQLVGLPLQPLGQQAAAASHADRVVLAAEQFAGVAAGAVGAVGFGTDALPAQQAAEQLQLAGELCGSRYSMEAAPRDLCQVQASMCVVAWQVQASLQLVPRALRQHLLLAEQALHCCQ
jgi:hypothetical protein